MPRRSKRNNKNDREPEQNRTNSVPAHVRERQRYVHCPMPQRQDVTNALAGTNEKTLIHFILYVTVVLFFSFPFFFAMHPELLRNVRRRD